MNNPIFDYDKLHQPILCVPTSKTLNSRIIIIFRLIALFIEIRKLNFELRDKTSIISLK